MFQCRVDGADVPAVGRATGPEFLRRPAGSGGTPPVARLAGVIPDAHCARNMPAMASGVVAGVSCAVEFRPSPLPPQHVPNHRSDAAREQCGLRAARERVLRTIRNIAAIAATSVAGAIGLSATPAWAWRRGRVACIDGGVARQLETGRGGEIMKAAIVRNHTPPGRDGELRDECTIDKKRNVHFAFAVPAFSNPAGIAIEVRCLLSSRMDIGGRA